jgi:Sulfotransferase domain
MDEPNQETKAARVRSDMAARLFRPHWPFIWLAGRARVSDLAAQKSALEGCDVICAGMYRACSTWQYEVVAHLLERHRNGERLGYLTGEQYTALVGAESAPAKAATAWPARWRVVKSHEGNRSFARRVACGRAIAVYAHRDVRDVAFSLMHKRGVTFEQLVRHGMIHQVLANDRFWRAQPGVLVQRYDDLTSAPAAGVIALAQHLGIELDDCEAQNIAGLYSIESNRARTEALRRKLAEAGVDLESASSAQICDPKTLLHWNHMRGGAATTWRSAATPRQRMILDRLCGDWLEQNGYAPDATLAVDRARSSLKLTGALRDRADVLVGRRTFAARAASQSLPGVARFLKHTLGMPLEAGAMAWADTPTRAHSGHESAAPHLVMSQQPGGVRRAAPNDPSGAVGTPPPNDPGDPSREKAGVQNL